MPPPVMLQQSEANPPKKTLSLAKNLSHPTHATVRPPFFCGKGLPYNPRCDDPFSKLQSPLLRGRQCARDHLYGGQYPPGNAQRMLGG